MARDLLDANLAVIQRVISYVSRHAGLSGADAEDFASAARLRILDNDCAVLARYEGRASLSTYLTIVLRRFLVDYKRAERPRWYASAEAQRRGGVAILLERLIRRDGRTIEQAVAIARMQHSDLTVAQLEAIAADLPNRQPAPSLVAIEDVDAERFPSTAPADDLVEALDLRTRSRDTSRAVRAALLRLTPEDRVIIRLRFGKGMSVADIARAMGIAQRPLYRRLDSLIAGLRRTLEHEGVDAGAVADLVGGRAELLDFGLAAGENDAGHPSIRSSENPSGVPKC